jgi:hypothetical protein
MCDIGKRITSSVTGISVCAAAPLAIVAKNKAASMTRDMTLDRARFGF